MGRFLSIVGKNVFLAEMGNITRFAGRFFVEGFKPRYEFREFIRQCYWVGYKSLPLVGITAFIMGLVLTIQSRPTLVEFGAESMLPAMVSISLVREISPVITALICAGKVGSGMGAELGSMRVTEQIDAMEVSGTNPFKYLIVTRILATTLMLPVLSNLSNAVALYGGYLGVNIRGTVSWHLYWSQVYDALSYGDLIPSIIKTFFFGFAIGLVGCYKGYYSTKGTEGVGRSANSAVVVASLLVFIIDLIAVQITDILGLT
ncbi:ABC transporter permease protein [Fulvivirga imtechensis AK7]|uniref:ABC transporter permease protein n=1 Tax=Fulvivirga imtechensis AK7 TaxID=1237149 RepID=L8JRZ9_9BACT|nr:ABC transporter permease [Fulvivirga imtechensis]ELR70147.1 ABC transporter permease protein [Fulvivirga imtechensis AK7]